MVAGEQQFQIVAGVEFQLAAESETLVTVDVLVLTMIVDSATVIGIEARETGARPIAQRTADGSSDAWRPCIGRWAASAYGRWPHCLPTRAIRPMAFLTRDYR